MKFEAARVVMSSNIFEVQRVWWDKYKLGVSTQYQIPHYEIWRMMACSHGRIFSASEK